MKRKLTIASRGWPWQPLSNNWASPKDVKRYGWNPFKVHGMGRFGGGWAIKFGVDINRTLDDFCIYLGIGMIRITFREPKP